MFRASGTAESSRKHWGTVKLRLIEIMNVNAKPLIAQYLRTQPNKSDPDSKRRIGNLNDSSVIDDGSGNKYMAALSVLVEVVRPSGSGSGTSRSAIYETAALKPVDALNALSSGSSTEVGVSSSIKYSQRSGLRVVWDEEVDIRCLPNGEWPFLSISIIGHSTVPTAERATAGDQLGTGTRRTGDSSGSRMSKLFGFRSASATRKLASVVIDLDVQTLREAAPLPVEQWHYMLRSVVDTTPSAIASSPENGELRIALVWIPSLAESQIADEELARRIRAVCDLADNPRGTAEVKSSNAAIVNNQDGNVSSHNYDEALAQQSDAPEATPDRLTFEQRVKKNYAFMGDENFYCDKRVTNDRSLANSSADDQSTFDIDVNKTLNSPASLYGAGGYDRYRISSPAHDKQPTKTESQDSGYVDSDEDINVIETSDVLNIAASASEHVDVSSQSFNSRFQSATERLHTLSTVAFQVDSSASRMAALREARAVNLELMELYQDFLIVSQAYGRIIISEVALPISEKTIKPVESQVGTLGGQKFLIQGIMFKFASDRFNLFSGDLDAAAKVAGHELKGISSVYGCNIPGLCVPLCALIDFMGFRVVALAELPIRPSVTLVSGSADGGNTIVSLAHSDIIMRRVFDQASGAGAASSSAVAVATNGVKDKLDRMCTMLNLLPHSVSSLSSSSHKSVHRSVQVYGPTDLEVHIGFDNRVYCLDFSRLFPPETPIPTMRSSHLYRLLRPELCKRLSQPICSDAFSSFLVNTPDVESINEFARHATEHLRAVEIPRFVHTTLVPRITVSQREGIPLHEMRVDTLLHGGGVNLRFLGLCIHTLLGALYIRPGDESRPKRSSQSHIGEYAEILPELTRSRSESVESSGRNSVDGEREPSMLNVASHEPVVLVAGNKHMVRDAVTLLAIEATARTIKELWRKKMRVLALRLGGPRTSPFVRLAVKIFNCSLGNSDKAQRFWEKLIVRVAQKFDVSLKFVCKVFNDRIDDATSVEKVRRFLAEVPHFASSDGRLLLLHRLIDLTGVRLRSHLLKRLHHGPLRHNLDFRSEIFGYEDVKELALRSKTMAIISRAQGFMNLSRGLEEGSADDLEMAVKHLEEALRRTPHDTESMRLLALTLFRLEIQRATERRLRQLQGSADVTRASTNGPLHLDKNFIYSSKVERANHLFRQALAVDPSNAESCMQYAYFLARCNQTEKSLEFHLQALELDPTYQTALEGLEQLLQRSNRPELAAMIANSRKKSQRLSRA